MTGLFGITKESWTSGCVCSMPTFAGVGGNNMGLRQIEIFLRKGADFLRDFSKKADWVQVSVA